MSKNKRNKMRSLEHNYGSMMDDLKRVGGSVPHLVGSDRGFAIMLDKNAPVVMRNKFISELMKRGGRITGAITGVNNTLVEERYIATPLSISNNDYFGAILMYFSREFVELERELVKNRAQIMALKLNLKIDNIEFIGEDSPINSGLHPIGFEQNWEELAERVAILFRRGCIQLFNSASMQEITGYDNKPFPTVELNESFIKELPDLMQGLYPNPVEILTSINEDKFVDSIGENRTKQFMAFPTLIKRG